MIVVFVSWLLTKKIRLLQMRVYINLSLFGHLLSTTFFMILSDELVCLVVNDTAEHNSCSATQIFKLQRSEGHCHRYPET